MVDIFHFNLYFGLGFFFGPNLLYMHGVFHILVVKLRTQKDLLRLSQCTGGAINLSDPLAVAVWSQNFTAFIALLQ